MFQARPELFNKAMMMNVEFDVSGQARPEVFNEAMMTNVEFVVSGEARSVQQGNDDERRV